MLRQGDCQESEADAGLIKSLTESSRDKLESEKRLAMDDVTAASKLTLAYGALRELLEALALKNGYKVYNHECYTAFLKEIVGESEMGDEFDEIRRLRNAINYYGKRISARDAERFISRVRKLRGYINNMLEK